MSLQTIYLTGMDKGLVTNAKPMLIPDKAWQYLYNAYCWRQRILRREGLELVGRLQRNLTSQALGNTTASTTFTLANIFTTLSIPISPVAPEIAPGSLVITVAAPDTSTFADNGDGTFSVTGLGEAAGSYINYNTGELVLNFSTTLTGGAAVTANFSYYPIQPVMGAPIRQSSTLNVDQTIFFDQTYAYVYAGSAFTEWIPGTTWTGSNSQFFWGFNYRGAAPQDLLLFATNFNINDPMRYSDTVTWTNFAPLSTATTTIYQARIIISYYGRLLLMNTWEGATAGGSDAAVNITNRLRFSALGSPIDVQAFRTDIFGKGGVIDAPTNQEITGATFIKNTLVVDFETETWQLRYVGEYGQPFVWERVSADFGSPSTFSGVLFDNFRLSIGDTAITGATATGVDRIDLDFPDQVFQIQNVNDGVKRVFGIRDYQRELVFWNYPDAQTMAFQGSDETPAVATTYPTNVFVYNYRNKTWAIFRDSVTCFSLLASSNSVTWDSQDVTWDDENITWDDFDTKTNFEYVVSGNQQGYIHRYGYVTQDEPSLSIHSIDLTTTPIRIVSPNHNLQPDEIIQLSGLLFLSAGMFTPLTSSLNEALFAVIIIDENTIGLSKWDFTEKDYHDFGPANDTFTPVTSAIYVGGGQITLYPTLDVQTKDFNIYAQSGMQTKISSIDFLMEMTEAAAMTVNIFTNSAPYPINGNMSLWSTNVSTYPKTGFNQDSSQYAWFKFVATASGQYFNINLTWDDNLKNSIDTYQEPWTLYGINAYCRPGGRMVI